MQETKPNSPAQCVAFYSFKGGVGRTLGLANVAHLLAAMGHRVLMVDGDLEAPGLSLWPGVEEAVGKKRAQEPEGTSLGLSAFTAALAGHVLEQLPAPRVQDFSVELWPQRELWSDPDHQFGMINMRMERMGSRGCLHLLPVDHKGLGPSYLGRVEQLDEAIGSMEVGLKQEFRETVQEAFRRASSHYSLVLLDTRTGFTGLTASFLAALADHLVIVSGLNKQNVVGTEAFVRNFGGLFCSEDSQLCFVLSPLPAGELAMRDARIARFRSRLAAAYDSHRESGGELDHAPRAELKFFKFNYMDRLALAETGVVCGLWPDEPLSIQYQRVCEWVLQRAGLGFDHAEKNVNAALEKWKELTEPANGERHAKPGPEEMVDALTTLAAALERAISVNPERGRGLASIIAHRKFVSEKVYEAVDDFDELEPFTDSTDGLRFPLLNLASRADPADYHLREQARHFHLRTHEAEAYIASWLRDQGKVKESREVRLTPVREHTQVNYLWRFEVGGKRLFLKHATPLVRTRRGPYLMPGDEQEGPEDSFMEYPSVRLEYEANALALYQSIWREARESVTRGLTIEEITPEPLHFDRAFSVLLMNDVGSGKELLVEALDRSEIHVKAAARLGELIGHVHGYTALRPSIRIRSEDDEIWTRDFIWRFKTEGLRRVLGEDAVGQLRARSADSLTSLLFVDLADKNIYVNEEGDVAICDFEAVVRGDPAFDIGHLLGHYFLALVRRPEANEQIREACQQLWGRYKGAFAGAADRMPRFRSRMLSYAGVLLLHRSTGSSRKELTESEAQQIRSAGAKLFDSGRREDLRLEQAFEILAGGRKA